MKKHLSIPEAAKILGISRIALYKQVKAGKVKAERVGRNYIISSRHIEHILSDKLSKKERDDIKDIIKRIFNEYGETLEMLGKE